MIKLFVIMLQLMFAAFLAIEAFCQTPTQIKQVLPGTPNVTFNWTYNTTDEVNMDSFVLKNTGFSLTVTITSPYNVEQVINQKTIRSITHTLPATTTAQQKAFYNMIARKQGLADSAPSNVVEIQIVPTPPAVQNLNIARFTEIEFTHKELNGVKLWFVTGLLGGVSTEPDSTPEHDSQKEAPAIYVALLGSN